MRDGAMEYLRAGGRGPDHRAHANRHGGWADRAHNRCGDIRHEAALLGKVVDDLLESGVGIACRRLNCADAVKLNGEQTRVTAAGRVEVAGKEAKVRNDADEKGAMA